MESSPGGRKTHWHFRLQDSGWMDTFAGSDFSNDDTNHLYETLDNYYFKDEEE